MRIITTHQVGVMAVPRTRGRREEDYPGPTPLELGTLSGREIEAKPAQRGNVPRGKNPTGPVGGRDVDSDARVGNRLEQLDFDTLIREIDEIQASLRKRVASPAAPSPEPAPSGHAPRPFQRRTSLHRRHPLDERRDQIADARL